MDTRRTGCDTLKAAVLCAGVFAAGCTQRGTPTEPAPAVDAARQGWIDLTPGPGLEGWMVAGGAATFRVERGEVIGETARRSPNTFLCTEREYGDFELALEFQVDDGLNSGVQVRSRVLKKDGRTFVAGYQVEIDPSARSWTGGIYEERLRGWLVSPAADAAAQRAFVPGRWNTMRVLAEGDRLRTWINGVPVSDLRDGAAARGVIGLQVHSVPDEAVREGPLRIRWRNIRLREIGSEPGL